MADVPKVLIANRGAIACRIIRTLRRMGVGSVAVYSEADRHSLHVAHGRRSGGIGPAPGSAKLSVVRADLRSGARDRRRGDPSRLWLSERERRISPKPARASGIVFIGPTPEQMRAFGLKHTARGIAAENSVPLLPGTGLLPISEQRANEAAERIGYPVMLKSTAGGGGIGMRLVPRCRDELRRSFEAVERTEPRQFQRRRHVSGKVRRASAAHRSSDLRRRQGAMCSLWANAIVPRSAAIRR